jgi:uncharacterized SAM-binding protein YcdF (DUF218 family)
MEEKDLFIALVAYDSIRKSDAVILLEGDGFERINKACSLVKEGWAPILIFSGGIVNYDYGSFPYNDCLPRIWDTGITDNQVIWESKSLHTKDQAVNIVSLCIERGWKRIILVASHYHQFRVFLTFLKELKNRQLDHTVIISNVAASEIPWFASSAWGTRFEMFVQEFKKIEKYIANGDVANYADAINYFKWKELQ